MLPLLFVVDGCSPHFNLPFSGGAAFPGFRESPQAKRCRDWPLEISGIPLNCEGPGDTDETYTESATAGDSLGGLCDMTLYKIMQGFLPKAVTNQGRLDAFQ